MDDGLLLIVSCLNAGTAVMAVATGVYHGTAPEEAAYPFVQVDYGRGAPEPTVEGGWEDHVFVVKAVDKGPDVTRALQLQGLIKARLVPGNMSLAGRSVVAVKLVNAIEYPEVDGDEFFWHAGYEVRIVYA